MLYQLSYTPAGSPRNSPFVGALCRLRSSHRHSRPQPYHLKTRQCGAKSRFSSAARPGLRSVLLFERADPVARTSPGEFIRQVRVEAGKVVWPTGKETWVTAVMVFIITSLLAIFFFAVDSGFAAIVQFLLGLLA